MRDIDPQQLHAFLAEQAKHADKAAPALGDVVAALAGKDLPARHAAHRARIEVQVWDGTSPINGASADYVHSAHPWADVVYLLLIDGQVAYLQSHEPGVPGHVAVTAQTVDRVSAEHADEVAWSRAAGEVAAEVADQVGLSLGG